MSGHPNENQVRELRQCAELVAKFDAEAEVLRMGIVGAQERLKRTLESRGRNAERALKLVEMMDCRSAGNYGYEHRMVLLLSMLVKGDTQ